MKNICILFTLCNFSLAFVHAQTSVTFQPNEASSKDAYTLSSNDGNYGTSQYVSLYLDGTSSSPFIRRIFIYFDISSIPSNAIVTSAEIQFYKHGSCDGAESTEINRILESWTETGVKPSNEPQVDNSDMITLIPTVSGSWHYYNVKNHVQDFVNYPHLNLGWRIKNEDETQPIQNCHYYSSNYGTASYRPKLVIEYVLPIEIALDQIVHADLPTSSNGSISITASEGNGTYTYQWIDGATGNDLSGETASSISGLSPGWYGVEVTDGLGNISYMAFIVGAKCGVVQINFQPDGRFVDDAYVMDGVTPFMSDPPNTNFGTSATLFSERYYSFTVSGLYDYIRQILFRNRLIIPNNIDLVFADQHFFGYSHLYTNGNKSKLLAINEDWQENVVTWEIKPNTDALALDLIPSTSSSSENIEIDHTTLYSNYQSGSSNNYGYNIQLDYDPLGTTDREMSFYSSDYSTTSKRPKLVLTLGKVCMYAKPQKRLDAETYEAINGFIYFEFNDEYVDSDGELNYMLYNEDRKDAFNGSSPNLDVNIGDNRCSLDVSSLSTGIYILELTNDKKEKFLIRFKI